MEFVILGLLLLKPMSAYEISSFIRKNLALICSGSAGSVQIALKKLLKNRNIQYTEFVENSINKKIYSITEGGDLAFRNWVATPMQTRKVKNMELSKLFFLGFAEQHQQMNAIQQYIHQLTDTRNTLVLLQKQFQTTTTHTLEHLKVYWNLTLQYGIDSAEFEIQWYSNVLNTMKQDHDV